MPENYGLLTNMASGIREGMNTYMLMKNQQRQENQLAQQIKMQEQDRQMKMLQAGMTEDPEGGGLMLTSEAKADKQRKGLIEQASLLKSGYRISKDPQTGEQILEPIPGFQDLDRAYKQSIIDANNKKTNAIDNKLTDAQKGVDKKLAGEYSDFNIAGGVVEAEESVSNLENVIALLKDKKTKPGTKSRYAGILPGAAQDIISPESRAIGDKARSEALKSLKLLLPGPASDADRNAVLSDIYNDRQTPEENISRIERFITRIRDKAALKKDASDYYEQHGTMVGWKGGRKSGGNQKSPPKDPGVKNGPSKADSEELLKSLGF